jgi:hypothetical protein
LAELIRFAFEIDLYASHEKNISKPPPRKGQIYLTKKPKDILIIEPILKRMSNLTVLYVVRDPRDIVVSKHGIAPDKYWCSLTYWKAYTPFGKRLNGHPRFIQISYEMLINEPDVVQKQIMERIPYLKKIQNFSDFSPNSNVSDDARKALKSVRKVSNKSMGSWKNHLPRIKQLLQTHGSITQDLIDFGYETNGDWENLLSDVEDKDYTSYKPEFLNPKTFNKRQRKKELRAYWAYLGHSNLVLSLKSLFKSRT